MTCYFGESGAEAPSVVLLRPLLATFRVLMRAEPAGFQITFIAD